jgi:hypothetical protein
LKILQLTFETIHDAKTLSKMDLTPHISVFRNAKEYVEKFKTRLEAMKTSVESDRPLRNAS